jgi:PAS domain S-box-containing protein
LPGYPHSLAPDLRASGLLPVLRTALDAVVIMRADGTVAGWNGVASETFGYSGEEALGRKMTELIIPPRYRQMHDAGLQHYNATGEGPVLEKHLELEAVRKDGTEIPVELNIAPYPVGNTTVFLGFLRDITTRRLRDEQRMLLMREMGHRVKNMLAVINGMAHMTMRHALTLDDFYKSFTGRLATLTQSYGLLTGEDWQHADLASLLERTLGTYTHGPVPQLTASGPPVELPAEQVVNVGLIMHELMTNSVKYGALQYPTGAVAVTWYMRGTELVLSWRERSPEFIGPPGAASFGTRLIDMTATNQLRGKLHRDWPPQGLQLTLEFTPGAVVT